MRRYIYFFLVMIVVGSMPYAWCDKSLKKRSIPAEQFKKPLPKAPKEAGVYDVGGFFGALDRDENVSKQTAAEQLKALEQQYQQKWQKAKVEQEEARYERSQTIAHGDLDSGEIVLDNPALSPELKRMIELPKDEELDQDSKPEPAKDVIVVPGKPKKTDQPDVKAMRERLAKDASRKRAEQEEKERAREIEKKEQAAKAVIAAKHDLVLLAIGKAPRDLGARVKNSDFLKEENDSPDALEVKAFEKEVLVHGLEKEFFERLLPDEQKLLKEKFSKALDLKDKTLTKLVIAAVANDNDQVREQFVNKILKQSRKNIDGLLVAMDKVPGLELLKQDLVRSIVNRPDILKQMDFKDINALHRHVAALSDKDLVQEFQKKFDDPDSDIVQAIAKNTKQVFNKEADVIDAKFSVPEKKQQTLATWAKRYQKQLIIAGVGIGLIAALIGVLVGVLTQKNEEIKQEQASENPEMAGKPTILDKVVTQLNQQQDALEQSAQ